MHSPTDTRNPIRSGRQVLGFVGRAATRFWPAADAGRPPRASIVMIPGRGESVDSYERTAVRLAIDGYDVTYLSTQEHGAVALAEARVPGVPFILLGSDTGALRSLSLAGSPALRPDALILLGLPLVHQPFAGELPTELPPRVLPDLPVLLIHGEQDETSPLHLTKMITRTVSTARLTTVPGGHQIMTGPGVRLVAALTVLFVETLRQIEGVGGGRARLAHVPRQPEPAANRL
ncbi:MULTISPECIES: alpha/beta hydrolase [unclassified Parafrankia]|uniref:alpha/beta hydrolase n=1 Tax=unclassified Parafrankia TaxID=2994368 RepID=UPI000DA53D18|nr:MULTISPECIES: alpha/beta hydrolase [unclassified Parafrankia]TCJ32049.1 alpha/beta hydrolase [Parafrankia sp. BMG5.11]SQD98016.1 conserved hypothetical protein [Parafrankia sp. Ea1.12]